MGHNVYLISSFRRRRNPDPLKEIDYDIRENIINYEDEGGGEGDQAGYDLSVLRFDRFSLAIPLKYIECEFSTCTCSVI